MNPIIKKQLDNVRFVPMPEYNDSTTHIEYDELCDIIENTYWYNFFSNDTDSILKNLNSIDNDLERLNHNISYLLYKFGYLPLT